MRGELTPALGLPASRARGFCIAVGFVGAMIVLLPPELAEAARRAHAGGQPTQARAHATRSERTRGHATTQRSHRVATRGKSHRPAASRHRRRQIAHRPTDPAKLVMPDIPQGDGSSVLDVAARFLGRPYRFGAAGTDSFDCSGFVRYVFGTLGIDLPHSAHEQFRLGDAVTRYELEPGDLVFFGKRRVSHVGIFVGDDKFVHAATRPGQVQVDSLADGYYARVFRGARRIEG